MSKEADSPVNSDWRAILFDQYLRTRRWWIAGQLRPLTVEERAYLVAERYPHTANRLEALTERSSAANA